MHSEGKNASAWGDGRQGRTGEVFLFVRFCVLSRSPRWLWVAVLVFFAKDSHALGMSRTLSTVLFDDFVNIECGDKTWYYVLEDVYMKARCMHRARLRELLFDEESGPGCKLLSLIVIVNKGYLRS